jgi:hypothetical protein
MCGVASLDPLLFSRHACFEKKHSTSLKHVWKLFQWDEVYKSEKSANYLTVGFKIL